MKRNKKRVVIALLAICALAAGGAAFTAAISGGPTYAVAGFAQTKVDGAEVTAIHWTTSQDGQYITEVDLGLAADGNNGTTAGAALPGTEVVRAGFNVGTSGAIDWSTCTTSDHLAYTCNMDTTANTNGAPVTGATLFNISATDTQTQ